MSVNQQQEASLIDTVLVLAQSVRLIIIAPLVGGLIALAASFLIAPTYTATARILPPQQQQSSSAAIASQLGALAGLVGGAGGLKSPADQYAGLLKSQTILDAVIKRFGLRQLYGDRYIEDTRKE